MSKKYGAQISFWSLPNECYLFSNKRYIRRGITLEFPLFGKENIPLFEEKGIPFKEYDSTHVTVWNPEVYAERDITLPAFVRMPGGMYRHIGNHTESFPTEETVEKARKYAEEVVKPLIEENKIKALLKGREAVGVKLTMEEGKNFGFIVENVYYQGRFGLMKTEYTAIFDKKAAEFASKDLTLEVPKGTEGLFIGRGGWQVKHWSKLLGYRRINVVGV